MAFTIATSIVAQTIGPWAERIRLKNQAAKGVQVQEWAQLLLLGVLLHQHQACASDCVMRVIHANLYRDYA